MDGIRKLGQVASVAYPDASTWMLSYSRVHVRLQVHLSEQTSEWAQEKVSHMGASVPCNTSPTDGGDIRAADVQMKLTDFGLTDSTSSFD